MIFIFLVLFWLFLVFASITLGHYDISFEETFKVVSNFLFNTTFITDELKKDVILDIRLPRILLSSATGATLSLSGLILQGVFKNPLVGPHIVGVSTGAAFGGVLAIAFGLSFSNLIILAFIFGMLSLGLVFLLASFISKTNLFTLILCGIITSGFFSALINLVKYLVDDEDKLPNIVFWLLGSFSVANMQKFYLFMVIVTPVVIVIFLLRWRLNLLVLDDNDIKMLGVRLNIFRFFLLLASSIMISAQVSVSGNIGWVGLIVPHLSKKIVGNDHIKSVPASLLIGASFMLLIDDISRTWMAQEIPLGILTSLIGAPIFAILLKVTYKSIKS